MAIASRLRDDLTISRFTRNVSAEDARGHMTADYVDDAAAVKGNLQERESREIATGQLDGVAVSDAIVFLPITTATSTLRAPDRLRKGGTTYQLVGLPRDAGGRGRHLEADLVRVAP